MNLWFFEINDKKMVYNMQNEKILERKNRIYNRYQDTIVNAIAKAVELTKNQDEDIHVEIFMNYKGYVHISEIMSSNTSSFGDEVEICNVNGWQENLLDEEDEGYENSFLDAEMRALQIEEHIEYEQVIKDYLFYD